jgi:hypothetical protein
MMLRLKPSMWVLYGRLKRLALSIINDRPTSMNGVGTVDSRLKTIVPLIRVMDPTGVRAAADYIFKG